MDFSLGWDFLSFCREIVKNVSDQTFFAHKLMGKGIEALDVKNPMYLRGHLGTNATESMLCLHQANMIK